AARHDDARPGGRVVLFTSGQARTAMGSEIAYAVSKGAIHQMTLSLSGEVAHRGITVNAINPGPVDTGWATDPEVHALIEGRFPQGGWGAPADIANVIAWIVSDGAAWMTGEVLNVDGGFRG